MFRSPALALLTSVLIATPTGGREETANPADDGGPSDAQVDVALQVSADLLVSWQERYVPDPPVGRLPDDALAGWQERERARLAKLRGPADGAEEWPYEGVYRVGRDGHIPYGYRVGGTAIVCEALVRIPGFDDLEERRRAFDRGLAFVVRELESNPELSRGPKQGYDVRGWAHAYGLRILLLARERALLGDLQGRAEALIPDLIDRLAANETSQGGWNYANDRVSPFMTASTLLALYEARRQGFGVDDALVERALDGLVIGRTAIGSFAYSSAARGDVAMPGSAARSAIAEFALLRAGRSAAAPLRTAVDGFFDGFDDLLARKSRQGTHEGPFGIAPYYFLYGHVGAALAIEALPEADRPALRDRLRAALWRTRESDGSWNDRVFPRSASYSTAMAALALLASRAGPGAAWEPVDAADDAADAGGPR